MTPRGGILVVDDQGLNRKKMRLAVEALGYAAQSVGSGAEAIERCRREPFDLILLDILMPEMDGFEVLAALKADPKRRDIPVIVISSLDDDMASVVRAIELGAEDFLPKAFDPVLLRARVGACIEKKRLRDVERTYSAEIERQQRRADELLHAILPGPAVTELTDTQTVIPRRYENVVVLFADVVGFTRFCDTHEPEVVVRNLDLLARAFEALTATHRLEKIKTMGDAILATGGLLLENEDPVMAAVDCARATLEVGRGLPTPWGLRVGIHIGPVVAGIVGQQKFTFDLWGDTVNVAARLGTLGTEPAIHLSADAWRQVDDRVDATSLGPVRLKGRGEMGVYRVRQRVAAGASVESLSICANCQQ
jgi:class 3 adenylate cyclase